MFSVSFPNSGGRVGSGWMGLKRDSIFFYNAEGNLLRVGSRVTPWPHGVHEPRRAGVAAGGGDVAGDWHGADCHCCMVTPQLTGELRPHDLDTAISHTPTELSLLDLGWFGVNITK